MPNTILIPSAQNLPDGFCPQTWQSTVDAFAAAMRVTLPTSASQIVVSQTAPPPAEQDRIWFQVDGNNHVIAIKSFDSSTNTWERADDIPYYFNDIGAVNNLQISTGDSINVINDIGGRLFIIKASAANTSTAPTLTVDGCAATVIKKNGSEALQAGNITAGMLCILIYDGTQFQLLNPKYVAVANSYTVFHSESPSYSVPAQGASQEWSHGLTGVPTYNDCYLVCQNAINGGGLSADLGYSIGDRVHWSQAECGGSNQEYPALSLCADATKLKLVSVASPYQFFYLLNKSTGTLQLADPTKWTIVFVASKFVAA